jgi:hypothetical protein
MLDDDMSPPLLPSIAGLSPNLPAIRFPFRHGFPPPNLPYYLYPTPVLPIDMTTTPITILICRICTNVSTFPSTRHPRPDHPVFSPMLCFYLQPPSSANDPMPIRIHLSGPPALACRT